jgi:hypothetical protein
MGTGGQSFSDDVHEIAAPPASPTPHYGMLSHGRFTPLPLPAVGPANLTDLVSVSPGIAW